MEATKQVEIHTDGSCLGNPGPGGWAAVLQYAEHVHELSGGYQLTTNNRMEILGVVFALESLNERCQVTLFTDSQYVAKAIKDKWLNNWKRNGWLTAAKKPVKNKDLWLLLSEQLARHQVDFRWLKGHAGHPMNERCDVLARSEATKKNLPPDHGFVSE